MCRARSFLSILRNTCTAASAHGSAMCVSRRPSAYSGKHQMSRMRRYHQSVASHHMPTSTRYSRREQTCRPNNGRRAFEALLPFFVVACGWKMESHGGERLLHAVWMARTIIWKSFKMPKKTAVA